MFSSLVHTIEEFVLPLGASGVFLASFLEEIIAPIPSPFVQMASGFFFLDGPITLSWFLTLVFVIMIPVSLGVAFGSLLVYGVAFYAGKPALVRWGGWFGLEWKDVERMQAAFERTRGDELLLFGLRCVPIIPSVAISAFYGLIRYNLRKYLIFTFLGTLVRAGALAIVGWWAGDLYERYADLIDRFETYVLIAAVIAVLAFVIWRRTRRTKQHTDSADDV